MAAGKMSGGLGVNDDIIVGCHFYIRGQSDSDAISQAFFTEVSGMDVEIDVQTLEEGGVNDHVHKLLGRTKISDITLKNGLTNSSALWDWFLEILHGVYTRKNISIVLVDQEGTERHRRDYREAIPIKWSGPQLNAGQSAVAIQTLVLTHRGLLYDNNRSLTQGG